MKLSLLPLLTASAVLVLSSMSRVASAQSITVAQEASLPRLDANGKPTLKRALPLNPEGVSARDCLEDQRIRVPLQLTGFEPNATLEAWASHGEDDCTAQTTRIGKSARCWRLVPSDLPLQSLTNVDVRVQTLLAKAAGLPDGAPESRACTVVDRTKLTMHFLYFKPGQLALPAVRKSIDVDVDTVGSPNPGASIAPGDASVMLRWRVGLAATSATNVYCTRMTRTSGSCGSASLPFNFIPDAEMDANLRCMSVPGFASAATLLADASGKPLENDVAYAFAIASVDDFGNVGPLSQTVCDVPRAGLSLGFVPPDDDPGGCATGPSRSHAFPGVALGAAVLAIAIARRRARNRGA